jgi:hypothetical protein
MEQTASEQPSTEPDLPVPTLAHWYGDQGQFAKAIEIGFKALDPVFKSDYIARLAHYFVAMDRISELKTEVLPWFRLVASERPGGEALNAWEAHCIKLAADLLKKGHWSESADIVGYMRQIGSALPVDVALTAIKMHQADNTPAAAAEDICRILSP